MLSASEIKVRLAARAPEIAKHLLPSGRLESGNWCAGSTAGEKGDSLRVQVQGGKAGIWADFAGNEKGDMLDLWAAVRNISLGAAIREAKQYLGIADPVSAVEPKSYKIPKAKNIVKFVDNDPVKTYLIGERKLTDETITRFRLKPRFVDGKYQIAYPSFVAPTLSLSGVRPLDNPNDILAIKYIALERTPEGKKIVTQEPDCAPCLFGWQAFTPGSKACIITEGQIDAMTWSQLGYEALSVPNGTGDTENWINYEWDNLALFDLIYLSFDMDEPGREACMKVAKRLGTHRCLVVDLPHKDANECLVNGCEFEVFRKAIDEAKSFTPIELKKATDFRSQVHAQIAGSSEDSNYGFKSKIFGRRMKFRPGEMTMWSGHSSHGKSTLLCQIMAEAVKSGERVAIGSFETKGAGTIRKICHCVAFKNESELTHGHADTVMDWLGDGMWVFDVFGIMQQNKLFDLMLYAFQRCGVKQFVIDSMMKCDLNSEDYEAQRQFLNRLHQFAHEHDVHIHLVGHPRKGKDDDTPPGMQDIHGGQAVHAQPDNIIIVWRNKTKEKNRDAGKLKDIQENTEADTIAIIEKQRLTGDEFRVKLWFSRGRHRFTTHFGEGAPEFENWGIIEPEQQNLPAT